MNPRADPKRTLKRAIDLATLTSITAEDLLAFPHDRYMAIRRAAATQRDVNNPRFACGQCGHAVYAPVDPIRRLPLWKHRKGAPVICPWWTGDPSSIQAVSARQFGGNQEGPLHRKLKHAVAEYLAFDPATEPGSIRIEETLVGTDGRRRPDVRADHAGRSLAFEIQLATTQLPIIVDREAFYARESIHLVWLTWRFEPDSDRPLPMAFEDIYYSHRKNIFSLDEEMLAQTKANGPFLLRVFWKDRLTWYSKIVALRDLVFPAKGLPYGIDQDEIWRRDF